MPGEVNLTREDFQASLALILGFDRFIRAPRIFVISLVLGNIGVFDEADRTAYLPAPESAIRKQ